MSIRVAIAQINPKLGDLCANLALYEEKIRQGIEQKAELLVFPELSLTGYYLRDTVPSVALTMDSPEINRLKKLSRELPFIAGLVEESADHWFFNAAVYSNTVPASSASPTARSISCSIYMMVDQRCTKPVLIRAGFTERFVDEVAGLIMTSQFKRRLPVIAKVSQRTIDRDFRYSRDWGK